MNKLKFSVRIQILAIMSFFVLLVGGLSFRSTSSFLKTEKVASLREIQSLRIGKASQSIALNIRKHEQELKKIAAQWPVNPGKISKKWSWIRHRGAVLSKTSKGQKSMSLISTAPSERRIQMYMGFESSGLGVSIATPVKTATGVEWIEGRLSSNQLFSPLKSLNQGPIQALLLDLNGLKSGQSPEKHVLFSSVSSITRLSPFSKELLGKLPRASRKASLPSSSQLELNDGPALLAWGSVPVKNSAQNFQIISYASNHDILAAFQRFLMEQGFLIFLVLGAALFVGFKFASFISKPLETLVEASKVLQTGNFDVRVKIDRSDEIGALAEAFNKMGIGLKQREDDLTSAQNSINRIQMKSEHMKKLSEFTSELSKSLEIADLKQIASKGLGEAFGGITPKALYFNYDSNKSTFTLDTVFPYFPAAIDKASTLTTQNIPGFRLKTVMESSEIAMNSQVFETFKPYIESLEATNVEDLDESKWKIAAIKSTHNVPHGIILYYAENWKADDHGTRARYQFAIESSFDNATMHEEIKEVSIRDGLTGLFNVRHFKALFLEELRRSLSKKSKLAFLFFDVDHFKKFNDTHGHPAGDKVLKQVSSLMRSYFSQKDDIVARYGGEEFVVLLKDTDGNTGVQRAEAFRALIEQDVFEGEQTQPLGKLTISIGVSEYPSHGKTMGDVIQAADDALYDAKKVSRNTVVYAEDVIKKNLAMAKATNLPKNVTPFKDPNSSSPIEDESIEDLFKKVSGDE